MPSHMLRKINPTLWFKVRAKAAESGWRIDALLIRFLEDYAAGKIQPSGDPPEKKD